MNPTVYNCNVFSLPKINEASGSITALNNLINLPFEIARVFYLYDIPGGQSRGGHAHKECHQFIIATSGSFDITLDDGKNKKTIMLNRPNYGLYVPPSIWNNLSNFSSGAICLVLTSHKFDESDYIRNYNDFLNYTR